MTAPRARFTSIGLMALVNFIIDSDFKWLLLAFTAPWLALSNALTLLLPQADLHSLIAKGAAADASLRSRPLIKGSRRFGAGRAARNSAKAATRRCGRISRWAAVSTGRDPARRPRSEGFRASVRDPSAAA